MEESEVSLLNANTLELHYWFKDESHTMDAVIQNRCEYELLGILKELGSIFNAEISIETEPLANGGLRSWFKIDSKDKSLKAIIRISLITALATGIFITPITSSISKITEIFIERLFEDKALKELEKEKLKLEIEKLKQDTVRFNQQLDENNTIKKRRSNFYEALEKYPKIDKVSLVLENGTKDQINKETFVLKSNFKDFILTSDDLKPKEIDEAIIEIISPVLKKGKYKWMGIFSGETISFDMKSNEFKTLVQTGRIEFKNGSSINCLLVIRKKIDNEGQEKVVGYDVSRVNHYFENDKPIETPEGKFHRQKQEADKTQTKISFENS
jgi:hypothetical protein